MVWIFLQIYLFCLYNDFKFVLYWCTQSILMNEYRYFCQKKYDFNCGGLTVQNNFVHTTNQNILNWHVN